MKYFTIKYRELSSHHRGEVQIEAKSESEALDKFHMLYPYAIVINGGQNE